MQRLRSRALTILLPLAALLAASFAARANAEEPNASNVAAARALGSEGVKLANSGRCNDALDKLQRAERLFHAPTTMGRLGECLIVTGKIVAGTELLQRMLREPLAPASPAAFVAAYDRAKGVLEQARPRIARLVL